MLLLLLSVCAVVRAYDFAVVVPSGQTLYFNHVSGGVEVVYPNSTTMVSMAWNGFTKPMGALTVPSTVEHEGTTYAVVSVGHYAFRQCTGLTAVVLDEGVARVDTGAFYGCSGVTALSLPSTLAFAGNVAFSLMTSLADVWLSSALPPVVTGNIFNSVDLSACMLHVPCGTEAVYAATAPWSAFGTMQATACTATVSVGVNHEARGSVTGAGSYAVGTTVVLMAHPAAGYSFICWNDGDTLNPRMVNVVRDTAFTAMFFAAADTVYVYDTLMPDFYRLTVTSDNGQLGVGVGSVVVPAGTEVEVCGLPLEGGRFVGWDDGVEANPRRVTVNGEMTLMALFSPLGIGAVAAPTWSASVAGRRLTVQCGMGERLRLYDMQGRCHLSLTTVGASTTVQLPSAGVWLVQVGDAAARRIAVD